MPETAICGVSDSSQVRNPHIRLSKEGTGFCSPVGTRGLRPLGFLKKLGLARCFLQRNMGAGKSEASCGYILLLPYWDVNENGF